MADPDRTLIISGRRATLTRRELLMMFGGATGLVVFAVIQRQWVYLTATVVIVVVNAFRAMRPTTVIDRDGIRRPWRRVSVLPWGQVDHVVQPLYVTYVQVVTTDGRTINLTDVDVSATADVGALGDKPVKTEAVNVPRPVTRERTQREIEADVTRRAAELAAEREQLARTNIRRPKI